MLPVFDHVITKLPWRKRSIDYPFVMYKLFILLGRNGAEVDWMTGNGDLSDSGKRYRRYEAEWIWKEICNESGWDYMPHPGTDLDELDAFVPNAVDAAASERSDIDATIDAMDTDSDLDSDNDSACDINDVNATRLSQNSTV